VKKKKKKKREGGDEEEKKEEESGAKRQKVQEEEAKGKGEVYKSLFHKGIPEEDKSNDFLSRSKHWGIR